MATRRKPAEPIRTWRLRPFSFLPPSQPRSPFWGPQRTLWLSTRPVRGSAPRPAAVRAAGRRAGGAVPHALAAEAVPPPADRLPRREVLGQRPPAAALGDEVEASLHDRPNGGAQRTVRREEGHGQCPFPVRQIARMALPGLTVDFTVGLRPHVHACEVMLSSRENMGMLRSNRV